MHGTDNDSELSQAIALLKATELARLFGHDTTYGWPVYWGKRKVLAYEPGKTHELYIDSARKPRVMPRAKAITKLLSCWISQMALIHLALECMSGIRLKC